MKRFFKYNLIALMAFTITLSPIGGAYAAALNKSDYLGQGITHYGDETCTTSATTSGSDASNSLNIAAATKVAQDSGGDKIDVSFAVYDATGNKQGGVNETATIKGASITKSLLLVAYLQQVGKNTLTDEAKGHLKQMINVSSNSDANWVYNHINNPSQTVTALATKIGMRSFKIDTSDTLYIMGDSIISSDDFALFFSKIDTLIPETQRAYGLDVLSHRDSSLQVGFAKSGFSEPVYLKEGFKGESQGTAGPPFIINQAAQFTYKGKKYGVAATIHNKKDSNAATAQENGRSTIQKIGAALISGSGTTGTTIIPGSSSGTYTDAQVKAFATSAPIAATWNISDSTIEQWYLKQSDKRATVAKYGLNSGNIGDVTAAIKGAGVSPVYFYLYTITEGGGLGGFINHFGSDLPGGGVPNAKRDAEYIASQAQKTTDDPAWVDIGVRTRVDFVPADVKAAGNADFKNVPVGSIGRIYIPATAAAAWEVYYPNGLKKEFNKVQDYGGPIGNIMKSIRRIGGDPLSGSTVSTENGCGTVTVAGAGIDKAVNWVKLIAENDGYGYDQNTRTTGWTKYQSDPSCTSNCGSFDCSSFLSSALTFAGYYDKNPNFTANEQSQGKSLESIGFKKIATSATTSAGLQPGDILIANGKHTEMYIGNNQSVSAGHNENGGKNGGKTGDQTGDEIHIKPFSDGGFNKWDSVWRATK